MVYTLGFASILAFAAILTSASYVVSAIAEDAVKRVRLVDFLTRPWIASLILGAIYYAWMLVLASMTDGWKHRRLGDTSFTFRDGYWFSYISITTVGFGDIYLEPEVLRLPDCFSFPTVMLAGFVFLAAFLGKLFEALKIVFGIGRKKSIIDSVMGRFSEVDSGTPASERRSQTVKAEVPGNNVSNVEDVATLEGGYYDAQEEFKDARDVDDLP